MSLESVRAWLAEHAPDLPLIEVADTTDLSAVTFDVWAIRST